MPYLKRLDWIVYLNGTYLCDRLARTPQAHHRSVLVESGARVSKATIVTKAASWSEAAALAEALNEIDSDYERCVSHIKRDIAERRAALLASHREKTA